MPRRTKIICTIGPATSSYERILELVDAGMNVARLNFSHGTRPEHLQTIANLKRARKERKIPLAIMLDTKGPEMSIGPVENDRLVLNAKQTLFLIKEGLVGNGERISAEPPQVLDSLRIGDTILFDDGYITAKVLECSPTGVKIEIENAGTLKSHKGMNFPGVSVNLPAMTEQDVEDLKFGCEQDVDMIAASFIRSGDHVRAIKRLLNEEKKSETLVIAKIESSEGVENFDSILQVADGIMVARGDLGVELPLKQVPILQKMMIRKCIRSGKSVITATQMLESMINYPRPTRAEVSDVANAIYDSSSAVMLSGETAIGQYPIETVKMMCSIVEEAEQDFSYREFFYTHFPTEFLDTSSSISMAAIQTAYSLHANAIFAFTSSGFTAKMLSRFRPEMPILALTHNEKIFHQLALDWGVIPVGPHRANNVKEGFAATAAFAEKRGLIEHGDLVILTAGSPFGVSGSTNMLLVESIGEILVRGKPIKGEKVVGRVSQLLTKEDWKSKKVKDRIVVATYCHEEDGAVLQGVRALILQNNPDDLESVKIATSLATCHHFPLLIQAEHASTKLQEGQNIAIDLKKGVVYEKD